jgi:copper(I)-binding protein
MNIITRRIRRSGELPMPYSSRRAFLVIASCFAWAAAAHAERGVSVAQAWARATVPGQKVAGVYLDIRSDRAAVLTAVRSPLAASAEIHSMSNDNGVMRMRRLPRLDLPAGETVRLAPGGNHIMLLDITRPLHAGERVPLVLTVERNGKKASVQVQAEVRALEQ